MKRIAWFSLMATVLAALATAQTAPAPAIPGGTGTPKPEWLSKGTFPLTKDTTTFSVLLAAHPTVIDPKTNWFTLWLEKKTNVHLDLTIAPFPASAALEKLNLLLASGEYPQIIMSVPVDAAMEARFGIDEQIFLPVNKYIDDPKVMPNLNSWLAKNPDARGRLTAMDGKIYGFPNINQNIDVAIGQKVYINTVWLDKLKLKMPTTTDELYTVLKAFKEKDPNGNGKADEIPMMGSLDGYHTQVDRFLMSSFILDPGMYYSKLKLLVDTKTGKVLSALDQPGYKEGLKFLAKLYKEGLYYNNSILQKRDQGKQLMAQDPTVVGIYAGQWKGAGGYLNATSQNAIWRQYDALPPLKGPNGYASTPDFSADGVGPNSVVFTKALKNPELAARWIDAFYSYEVTNHKNSGELGRIWRWALPGEKNLEGTQAMFRSLVERGIDPQNDSWNNGPDFQTFDRLGYANPDGDLGSPLGVTSFGRTVTMKYLPFVRKDVVVMPLVKFSTAEAEELQILQVELERYTERQQVQFVAGADDVDKVWSDYTKKLGELGLPKFLALQQKAYDRQYKAKK